MRAGVIILQENKILLLHRFRDSKEFFVPPAGGVEDGETFEQTAIREAKEETNLDIVLDKKLWTIHNSYDESISHFFLVKSFSGELKLGGPESIRNSEENKYILEWRDFSDLKNLNIVPESLKEKLVNYFS